MVNELEADDSLSLKQALNNTVVKLANLAQSDNIEFSANIVLSDGKELAACRYANRKQSPSLYYIKDDSHYDNAVIVASEPLFKGDWISFPEESIIGVGENLDINLSSIS